MNKDTETPIQSFASTKQWKEWLAMNYATSNNGIWLTIFKCHAFANTRADTR